MPDGPVGGVPGTLASGVYRFVLDRRNRAFDRGVGVRRLDVPVISVGNLSVGGTGKTPMVERVVEWVLDARPCIAMRGYKSVDGKSDEAEAYRSRFPDVQVVAQPERYEGIVDRMRAHEIGCVVLDDGFQHRKLARDFDLVLVDATRSPFEDAMLPKGWLREPVYALERADAVVLTHGERGDVEGLVAGLSSIGVEVAGITEHAWTSVEVDGEDRPVESLAGMRVLPVCAIGNPEAFVEQVRSHAQASEAIVLRDHHAYPSSTVARIREACEGVDAILTTGKDWTKMRSHDWPVPVIVPRLAIRFRWGEAALRDRVRGVVLGGGRADAGSGSGL